jgi:hypothetical protein
MVSAAWFARVLLGVAIGVLPAAGCTKNPAKTHAKNAAMNQFPDNPSDITKQLVFTCAYEKDRIPPRDPEADQLYKHARWLIKANTLRQVSEDYPPIERLLRIATAYGHDRANVELRHMFDKGRAQSEFRFPVRLFLPESPSPRTRQHCSAATGQAAAVGRQVRMAGSARGQCAAAATHRRANRRNGGFSRMGLGRGCARCCSFRRPSCGQIGWGWRDMLNDHRLDQEARHSALPGRTIRAGAYRSLAGRIQAVAAHHRLTALKPPG